MYTDRDPVIAVIPHYNDAETLPKIVEQLSNQDYDEVFVIDDASPERDAFEAAVEPFEGNGVAVIRGDQNVGSARNRNRILEVERIEACGGAILHFVDADLRLMSEDSPATIRDILDDESIGMIGGLHLDEVELQSAFNFGPAFTIAAHVGGALQQRFDTLVHNGEIERARALRDRFSTLLAPYPDITSEPEARDVFWVIEANLAVPADVLKSAGGFTEMRWHEIQGLSLDLEKAGLRRRFDPRIAVQHFDGLAPLRRPLDQAVATFQMIGKYGLGRFIAGQYTTQL